MSKKNSFIDRTLGRMGLMRRQTANGVMANFAGAQVSRLMADFMPGTLSADQLTIGALGVMRQRSRQLVRNNEYATGIVRLIKKNVIGPVGIALQMQLEANADALSTELVAAELNPVAGDEIERAWRGWCRKGQPTVDGRHSWVDLQNLVVGTLVTDGEVFLRKVRGFRGNAYRYALQFIDADRVDATLNRQRRVIGERTENEIRLGVEVNENGAPVAYHVMEGHPSEGGAGKRLRIPAVEIIHIYQTWMVGQTRGIPLFHAAMNRLYQLGQYENAELVASRIASCMMGFFVTKTGEDAAPAQLKPETGEREMQLEAGFFGQLPEGQELQTFNPTHPQSNYSEFVKRMMQGVSRGTDVSYSSATGDLRDVNFSSLRQGVLEERDAYRVVQGFLVDHLCQPVFEDWFDMSMLSGQVRIPYPARGGEFEMFFTGTKWMPRGWTWVDPLKDVQAAQAALSAGMTDLSIVCAQNGYDWREIIDKQALQIAYAKKKGVPLSWVAVPVAEEPEPVEDEERTPRRNQ